MKPENGRQLIDYYDVVATQFGGTNVLNQKIIELQQDKDFLAASPKDQKAYLSHIDPGFAETSALDQNAYLAHITGLTGPSADIDGYTVQFVPGVIQEEQSKTIDGYRAALRRILMRKQAAFAGEAFASWIIPVVALYAFGWAVGWVRRGFGAQHGGTIC
jgi:hypothetical protein